MSSAIHYINEVEVLEVYRKTMKASEGGLLGVREKGGILATLDFIQNDVYYPTFTKKLSYLVFKFCSGRYFFDGNKRIALTIGTYFLYKNNYIENASIFMRQFEGIIYHVAASHIGQDLFLRIITAFMEGTDYDESLKIEIANAMSQGTLGIKENDLKNNEKDEI